MIDPAGWNRKLERHRTLVIVMIIVLSAALRTGYFYQILRGPVLSQNYWDQTDMNFFDVWAREIVGGDWLTNRSLHPYHVPYAQLAGRAYVRRYGEEGFTDAAGQAIWERWYGGKRFHQEPWYPYFIAAVYRVFGVDIHGVVLAQMALGVVNNVLIFLIARFCFGISTGLTAALLALIYGPFIFYESVMLRTTMITFTNLLAAWLAIRAFQRPSPPRFLSAGMALGLGTLTKSTILLFAATVLALITWNRRNEWKTALALSSSLLLGILLILSPAIARNLIVGVGPFELSSVGSVAIINANAADYPPGQGGFMSKDAWWILDDTGGRLFPVLIKTLGTHDSVFSYLKQTLGKFLAFWNWYEIPNNCNYYYYRCYSSILMHGQTGLGIIGILGIQGLFLARRRNQAITLYLAFAMGLACGLIFFNLSRYRVPTIALLLPFSAFSVTRLANQLSQRRSRFSVAWFGSLLALTGIIFLLAPHSPYPIRRGDYAAGNAICAIRARELIAEDRLDVADRILSQAISIEPPQSRMIWLGDHQPFDPDFAGVAAESYAELYELRSVVNRRRFRMGPAMNDIQRAQRLRAYVAALSPKAWPRNRDRRRWRFSETASYSPTFSAHQVPSNPSP